MAKLLAILVASAAVAGGATYTFFHYADPYHCPLSGCAVTTPGCCAPAAEAPASTDMAVAAAGPVAMFTESPVSACCAVEAKSGRAACCMTAAPAPNAVAVTAAVGPASVR